MRIRWFSQVGGPYTGGRPIMASGQVQLVAVGVPPAGFHRCLSD